MFKVDEFSRSCGELGLAFRVLDPNASRALVRDVFGKFKPVKTSGHVALGDDAVSIPLEPHEFSYCENLEDARILVFFEQQGNDLDRVVALEDGRSLGKVLENAYGMEYFVTNEKQTFLLAVNWYVVEGTGLVDWMRKPGMRS